MKKSPLWIGMVMALAPIAFGAQETGNPTGAVAPRSAGTAAVSEPGKAEAPATRVAETSGTASLDLSVMGRFEAARKRALGLYLTDTAGWAGTDTLDLTIRGMAPHLPSDTKSVSYVAWEQAGGWTVLFYYKTQSGKSHPMASVLLHSPLTRTSRGEIRVYDLSKKEPLTDHAARLARIKERGAALFEKAAGMPFGQPLNGYEIAEEDGTDWFYALMGDFSYASATAGPTFAVHLDADGKVLEQRHTLTAGQKFPMKLGSGETNWAERPTLKLTASYPETEDFLFLLLHPTLSPLVATAGSGTYILRAGELPEFRGAEPPETASASLLKASHFSAGMPVPVVSGREISRKEMRGLKVNEETLRQGNALYFNAFMIQQARHAIAGGVFDAEPAYLLDAVLEMDARGKTWVSFASPGSTAPCAVVACDGPSGPDNAWTFSVRGAPKQVSPTFAPTLSLLRAAKNQIAPFLGPGCHYFVPVLFEEGAIGQVFAWSNLERDVEAGGIEDVELVGSCVILTLQRRGDTYTSLGDFVIDTGTWGWRVPAVTRELPFGIRSAADPERGFFGPFEVLRCRLNSWLCPRLMKNGEGWVVVTGDGRYEVLSKRQEKKLKDLPPSLYPAKVYDNLALAEYEKKSSSVVKSSVSEKP